MTRDTAERARELAERYLLPGEGSNKDELIRIIKSGLTQIQADARLDPKQAKLAILALQHYKTACSKSGSAFQDSIDSAIAALAQALQLEEKEGK